MQPVATKWLRLQNLPWAITVEQLLPLLQAKTPYIHTVRINLTREGLNRGLAFAGVATEAERQAALESLQDFRIGPRKVNVMECHDSLRIDAPTRVILDKSVVFKTTQPANHQEDYYP